MKSNLNLRKSDKNPNFKKCIVYMKIENNWFIKTEITD